MGLAHLVVAVHQTGQFGHARRCVGSVNRHQVCIESLKDSSMPKVPEHRPCVFALICRQRSSEATFGARGHGDFVLRCGDGRGVTGRDGAAVVKVAPRATYVIRAWMPGQNGRPSLLPRCDQVAVKVQAALRAVTLHCDTGIR